jgi:hypothetical protein
MDEQGYFLALTLVNLMVWRQAAEYRPITASEECVW